MSASYCLIRVALRNLRLKTRIFPTYCQPIQAREMKRKAGPITNTKKAKRQQIEVPDYCDVELVKDHDNTPIWPAPRQAMEDARSFLREW